MKIKQLPEDFRVEEQTSVTPGEQGAFALYRLEKRGWTTPDALQVVRRRWQLEPRRLSYGGLKDRHAHTVQYFSVFHGPRRKLTHHDIHVEYLGQVREPYASHHIAANRFHLVLRALTAAQLPAAQEALAQVRQVGVPNYFDDQRFGSVERGEGGQAFVARALVEGRFDEALRLVLAAPYEHDRAPARKEKALLNAHWGDWATLKPLLERGHARSLVDYLVSHPTDFRGAVARLRPELRGLYLSAYQSYLWNRLLARWLQQQCRPEQLLSVPLRLGPVPMPSGLEPAQQSALAELFLPLPTARLRLPPEDPLHLLLGEVLAEEGLTLEQLKIRGIREMFFSRGERAGLCLPTDLQSSSAEDELNAGRHKLVLDFTLPRGSYATLLVKRLTVAEPPAEPSTPGQS